MKLNITTLVGAGAIAGTFLFGGLAVESVPTAHAKPPKPTTAEDPYKTCRAGGGTVKSCCAQVGGTYTETDVTAPNPTGPGTVIVGVKKSCSYSVAGMQVEDSGPVGPGGGVFGQVTPGTLAPEDAIVDSGPVRPGGVFGQVTPGTLAPMTRG